MDSILQEANAILEKDIEERLPDMPSEIHAESPMTGLLIRH